MDESWNLSRSKLQVDPLLKFTDRFHHAVDTQQLSLREVHHLTFQLWIDDRTLISAANHIRQ
jgi:hypothetical protein